MSVFLNNLPTYNQSYPENSIIHPYNTKVFPDYDTAVQQLMYKVLCPGEITFAYYNDELCEYGINVIFAVGPLIHGSGNTIFNNASELQRIFDELNTTIADVNTSINRVRNDLFNSLNDTSIRLDQTVADCVNSVIGPMNYYKTQIEKLTNDVYNIQIELNDKALNDNLILLENKHNEDIYNISTNIETKYSDILIKLDLQKEDIITYIKDAIKSSITETDDKNDGILSEARTELQKAFKTIKNEYYSLYSELRNSLDLLIIKHNEDINLIHTNINNLTNYVNTLQHDVNILTDKCNNQYNDLNTKITNLEHRFIHHLEEYPDSFNKDLIEKS